MSVSAKTKKAAKALAARMGPGWTYETWRFMGREEYAAWSPCGRIGVQPVDVGYKARLGMPDMDRTCSWKRVGHPSKPWRWPSNRRAGN